jgi:hypothetical protein
LSMMRPRMTRSGSKRRPSTGTPAARSVSNPYWYARPCAQPGRASAAARQQQQQSAQQQQQQQQGSVLVRTALRTVRWPVSAALYFWGGECPSRGTHNGAHSIASRQNCAQLGYIQSTCKSCRIARIFVLHASLAPEAPHLPRIYIVVDECVVHVITYRLDAAHGHHRSSSSVAVSTCSAQASSPKRAVLRGWCRLPRCAARASLLACFRCSRHLFDFCNSRRNFSLRAKHITPPRRPAGTRQRSTVKSPRAAASAQQTRSPCTTPRCWYRLLGAQGQTSAKVCPSALTLCP